MDLENNSSLTIIPQAETSLCSQPSHHTPTLSQLETTSPPKTPHNGSTRLPPIHQAESQKPKPQTNPHSSTTTPPTNPAIHPTKCNATPKHLGTSKGRSTLPNREQPGSSKESFEISSSTSTSKHTLRACDSESHSRVDHGFTGDGTHGRDSSTLASSESSHPSPSFEWEPNEWNGDNVRAGRFRSPRKSDGNNLHGKLAAPSPFPCERGHDHSHRSASTGLILLSINGPNPEWDEPTHVLQSGAQSPDLRNFGDLSRLLPKGICMEEEKVGSWPHDHCA
ncbi:hypothetical protein FCV25MIE_04279 [Fagus crenata]